MRKASNIVAVSLAGIRKKFKSDAVARTLLDEVEGEFDPVVGWVPTGIWSVDWLVSNMRGLPLGKGMVIWGAEGSGKSALVQYCMKSIEQRHGFTIYLDYDQALDTGFLHRYGLSLDRIIVPDVQTTEDGFDVVQAAIESAYGKKDADTKKASPMFVVWDSVAASAPRSLMEEESANKSHVADIARALSMQLKKLRVLMAGKPIIAVMITERRDNLAAMRFGSPDRLPHGKALPHWASTIIKTAKIKTLTHVRNGLTIQDGAIIQMTAMKSRFSPPGRRANFVLSFSRKEGEGGPHRAKSNFMFLKEHKLLISKGSKGVELREFSDAGIFQEVEFGEVLKTHGRKMRRHVAEMLCAEES